MVLSALLLRTSINDVSSEEEGGGDQKSPILLSEKWGGSGVIKSKKWADVVYGWPLKSSAFLTGIIICTTL